MHEVFVGRSYYASLCFYCLAQLGFTGAEPDPALAEWSVELSGLGAAFSFRAPLAGGPLFTLLYQIPAYLDIQTPEELRGVVDGLHTFVRTGSLDSLMEHNADRTAFWDEWYVTAWTEQILSPLRGMEEQACRAINRFSDLLSLLWDQYKSLYLQKLATYPFVERQSLLRAQKPFRLWADELGWDYPYRDFEFVICPESRSSASSLGPEKIVFGARHDEHLMVNSLIHEVGVRFFSMGRLARHTQLGPQLRQDYEGIIKLVETEVCFRKPRLMPGLTDDPFIRGMKLGDLIAWRSRQREGLDLLGDLADWYAMARAEGLL